MSETAVAIQLKGAAMAMPSANPDEGTAIIAMIERAARDPSVDLDKMERLYAMHERMEGRRAEAEFAAAMSECQKAMDPIRRDAENTQTHSKYATYAALDKVLRPIYTEHGFEVTFDTADATQPEHILVLCQITHKGGHKRVHRAPMACDGKGARGNDLMTKTHAIGSALMYGRRYTLGLGFNIVTADMKDDDGNAAAGGSGEPASEEQLAELKKKIERVGSDLIEFCTYFKIDKIADLPASEVKRAHATLDAFAKRGRK